MFLYSPGWPQIHVAWNIWSSCSTQPLLGLQVCVTWFLVLCGARGRTGGFMHARQANCKSWAPSLAFGPLCMSCLAVDLESAQSQSLTQEAEVHPPLLWPQWHETQAEMSQFPLNPLFPSCFLPMPSLRSPPPHLSVTELIPRVTNPRQQSEEWRTVELQRRDDWLSLWGACQSTLCLCSQGLGQRALAF